MTSLILSFASATILLVLCYVIYYTLILPRNNPLRQLPGPPVRKWFGSHMGAVLEYVRKYSHYLYSDLNYNLFLSNSPAVSSKFQEIFTKAYGRNIRIRGVVPVRRP